MEALEAVCFVHSFHLEPENPSIHYPLQKQYLCFCREVAAIAECKFSVACLRKKGQGNSFG